MPYITVGKENSADIQLYYEDQGEGRPVVLIHGWPLSGASWEKQVPPLLEAGYRVITYDRRGFGRSGRPASGYTYDTFAEDLNKILTRLELEDVTLVGFSMGGGEVARYIGTFGSRRIRSAALVSAIPPYLVRADDNPEGVDPAILDEFRRSITEDRPKFLSRFFQDFYNADVIGEPRISDDAIRFSWATGVMASAIACRDSVTAWGTDFRDDLPCLQMPVLIVHGDSDRIVPFESSAKRAHKLINGSRLVVVEGGPHGLNWTHAAQLNHALIEFLNQETAKKKPSPVRTPVRGHR